jgi:stage V sporulation protein B
VEHILIPYGLREFGLNQSQALEQYGMISGMVLPIVLFPYAFIHSFTSLLIPEISEAKSIGENKHIAYITTRAWRLTIIFGLCGAGILSVGSYELGVILYNSKQVGHYILCIAPLMALMYLDTVTDSILKGIGEHVYTMNINIADAVISVILVLLLVPQYGVYGYIAVLYLAELLNFSLSAYRLISKCRFKFKLFKWFLLPLMCVIIVSRIFVTIINYIELEKSTYVTLIIHILMILLAYLISLTITGCLDKEIRNWFAASIGLKRS